MPFRVSCRACFGENLSDFVDLGLQPPSNDYRQQPMVQKFYPLKMVVCKSCGLGQTSYDIIPEQIFSDYLYFSSQSPSWVEDRRRLAARMINEFKLDKASLVVDIGSNDGYYLKHFVDKGIQVVGYEPAANVAEVARAAGVPTHTEFWSGSTHARGCDLVNATNVLAHTPDMDGFIQGVAASLLADGVATLEFPLFSNLIKNNQLDTIYHEHYSYISIAALRQVLDRHGLRIWRIEELSSHGGSVRVFACRTGARYLEEASVSRVAEGELWAPDHNFEERAQDVKWDLLDSLAYKRGTGVIVGYGAPAKATVLANYAGLNADIIPFTIDDSPYKQGKYVPGTNIKIEPFTTLEQLWVVPRCILLFPWNLLEPIKAKLQNHYAHLPPEDRPQLVTAIPELTVTNL